jgi:hypothetical protein
MELAVHQPLRPRLLSSVFDLKIAELPCVTKQADAASEKNSTKSALGHSRHFGPLA